MADKEKADENPFKLQLKKLTSEVANKSLGGVKKSAEKNVAEEATDELFRDVFERYIPLSEISSKIAAELSETEAAAAYTDADVDKKSYEEIMNEGLTFFMSSDTGLKRTGLLSLFPALLTGIKLYSEMSESKAKNDLLEKIKKGIDVVFKFIYRDDDWRNKPNLKPIFDASPYEYKAFYAGSDAKGLEGRSYIDSISWAVPLFLKIMNLLNKDKEFVFDDIIYREKAKELIKWCLDYVNSAVLTIDAENENFENKPHFERPVGWNFSKIVPGNAEEQRSLYFTYAASSMYLSLYEEYKEIIDNLQTLNRAYDERVTLLIKSLKTSLKKEGIYEEYKEIIELDKAYDEMIPLLITSLEEKEVTTFEEMPSLKEVISLKEAILLKKDTDFKQMEKAISTLALNEDGKVDEDKEDELQEALGELKKYKGNRRKLNDYYDFNDKKSAEFNGKIYPNREINKKDNKSLGSVSRLKWNLEKISNDIWEKAKDKLEDNFIYDDFNFKIATSEAIQSGGQTNALFAGLLHISICLYSKYDFVVSYTKDDGSKFADGSKKFGKKAYNDMQNIMLLHVQRVQRFFDKLSEKKKAFGVDFLILRFPENFSDDNNEKEKSYPTDSETAERLRKQLIRITSLTPMLLKTNNLISKYVVQYPQKQMGESMVQIAKKRFNERNEKTEGGKKKYRWFWESDGYHAMSNYYYVGAIFDFYEYYEDYEQEYILSYTNLRKILVNDLDYTESVQAYYQKITKEMEQTKEEQKKEYEDKLKKMQEELEKAKKSEIGEKLFSDIKEAVKNTIDEPEFLKMIINGLRKQLAKDVFERYSDPTLEQEEKDLKRLKDPIKPKDDSFFSLLQALAADIILQSAIEAKKDSAGRVIGLGKGKGFDNLKLSEAAINGGEQLIIKNLLDQLFATICSLTVNFDNPNK